MHHYVYYSYESWGRGYIGARSCECLPEGDVFYFGSFEDKSFHPDNKIILTTTDTRQETNSIEILLHDFFEVDKNLMFANRAKATSAGFFRSGPHTKETINKISKNRKGKGTGPSSQPREHFKTIGKIGGKIGALNQNKKDKRKGGERARDEKLGFFALTETQNAEKSRKAAQTTNSLRYRCTITGKVSTPGGLARWQKARGIELSCRERVYPEGEGV